MAHSRVKPGGWGVNEKLTSAQQNALDINVRDSLDKTSAGDTISGAVLLDATGSVTANAAGSKLKTATGGRLELGDDDYPTLKVGHAGRTLIRGYKLCACGAMYAAAWTIGFSSVVRPCLIGNATTDLVVVSLDDMIQNGATLSRVDMTFAISNAHGGGLPAVQPQIVVERYKNDATQTGLGTATLAAGSAVAYYNGGNEQTLSVTGLTEVVDKTQYTYGLIITDESGANSVAGNRFHRIKVTEAITDLRPF